MFFSSKKVIISILGLGSLGGDCPNMLGYLKQAEKFTFLASPSSSFQVGVYYKIHLQILKIPAFHYCLTMVVMSNFDVQVDATTSRSI